jgi:hypothetical protein
MNWFLTLITFVLGFIAGSIGLFLFLFSAFKKSKQQPQVSHGVAEVEIDGIFDSEGNEIPKGSPLYNQIVKNITEEITNRPPDHTRVTIQRMPKGDAPDKPEE